MLVSGEMFAKEFVLNSCPPENSCNEHAGWDQREPGANSDRARGNGDAHGQVAGMTNEPIRTSGDEVMSMLALNAHLQTVDGGSTFR